MKTTFLIVNFLFLLTCACSGQGQDEIDRLVRVANTSPVDTIRVNAHYEIAKFLVFNDSDEMALNHALEGLKLALDLNYKVGIAKIYNLLGVLANFRGLSAQAAEYYEKAIDIFTELGNANGLAKCYTNLATI